MYLWPRLYALECSVIVERRFGRKSDRPIVIRVLMQTADVVIVGGGIVGSSIAHHLTAAGCRKVIVIERESAQGKGSTGKSMGGVRAQFSTPVNIQMSLYSIPFYASFDERLGYPCDYRPQGYLFCATSGKHMAYLRTNFEKQIAMGLKDV